MIEVSVVIATRNRREMLSEAIASVREQAFGAWELIVVDDASTDDTWAYLGALTDSRVRAFRQEQNRERSAARNRGLAEARAPMIMFLDDDDLLRPGTLANLVGLLRAHPVAVAAVGACRILQASGDSVKVYHPSAAHCRSVWRELLFGWWANSGQNLYRTGAVQEAGGFDLVVPCEDRKLWLRVAQLGPVCLSPAIAMEYRQHAGQRKPADIDQVRRAVWNDFIASLSGAKRREALRVRRAGDLAARSARLRERGAFGGALFAQISAIATAPGLLASPLTGRPLWWSLKKCLLRQPIA